ncbi:MAG: MFS transporter [Paracoccaceae bacterium]|nr:MFS transporter [Paracoccaceae bacterium]
MKIGIVVLVLGYVLSQFYRAFLAVLAPELYTDLNTTPEILATASGIWFLTFAAMQIPVGVALDKIGPRITASLLLAIGGAGGAFLFSSAQSENQIILAMGLIGIGCSPILMSAYYIFARSFSPKVFATLAGVSLGLGTMGNVASALPLTLAVQLFGWRGALLSLAIITFLVAVLIYIFVKNPEKVLLEKQSNDSVLTILKMPIIWPIIILMAVTYAPAAGIRGLWISPYLSDVFVVSKEMIGTATLIMGVSMILGSIVYGPLDRIISSKKTIIFFGNFLCAMSCILLFLIPNSSLVISITLLALVGFFGSSFAVIIGHGRDFIPAHLTGRGVTLLNLFGIGGAGILQAWSGKLFVSYSTEQDIALGYQSIFLFFGLFLLAGCFVYLFSKDSMMRE